MLIVNLGDFFREIKEMHIIISDVTIWAIGEIS